MTKHKATATAVGIGAVALALAACSSGSSGSSTVTVTATATPTAAATQAAVPLATEPVKPAATKAALTGLPAAPGGSSLLQTSNNNGVQYARYASNSEQPAQIVSYYSSAWQKEGYAMTSSGGGGGGYGKYGGADAGASGTKAGSYVNVQAGGSTSGPTYFEVCQGPNQSAVNECGNQSKSGSS